MMSAKVSNGIKKLQEVGRDKWWFIPHSLTLIVCYRLPIYVVASALKSYHRKPNKHGASVIHFSEFEISFDGEVDLMVSDIDEF